MYLFSAGCVFLFFFFFLADTLDFIISTLAPPQILHKISMPVSEGCQHLDVKACVCRLCVSEVGGVMVRKVGVRPTVADEVN